MIQTPPPVRGARWIPLTQSKFALVDARDYKRVSRYRWFFNAVSGGGYAARKFDGKRVYLHNFIGSPPVGKRWDHIDRNALNNRWSNLRAATKANNGWNIGQHADNRTGFKGVTYKSKERVFIAQIGVGRKYLGKFAAPEAAARAYDAAARCVFGEFACVNFPRRGERAARRGGSMLRPEVKT